MKNYQSNLLRVMLPIFLFGSTTYAVSTAMVPSDGPPDPPVIFIHYDYMAPRSWDQNNTNNFAPDEDDIAQVRDAFRRHGITLVIDPHHTEIPYTQFLFFGPVGSIFHGPPCPPTVCANFFDLKDQYFHQIGRQPWHYVIFGDLGYDANTDSLISGQAQIGGYDFMVTQLHRKCFVRPYLDFCKDIVSGTFMHELGHNLGLRHGGDVDENYKLNYVSVMNYLYQRGIGYTYPGDTYQFGTWFVSPPASDWEHIAGIRIDYSDGQMPALDENHLDERVGMGGRSTSIDVTYYFSCAASLLFPCKSGYIRLAAAPFDWNNDGIIETDVAAEINYVENFGGDLVLSRMTDHDDWKHILNFLRTPQYTTGTLRSTETISDPAGPDR